MKKILLYTLMTVAAAGMTACEDFLTRDTYDQIGSDEFWKSETDLELYANGFIQKMIPGDGTITRGDIDADYCAVDIATDLLRPDGNVSPDNQGGWTESSWTNLRRVNYMLDNMHRCRGRVSDEVYNHYGCSEPRSRRMITLMCGEKHPAFSVVNLHLVLGQFDVHPLSDESRRNAIAMSPVCLAQPDAMAFVHGVDLPFAMFIGMIGQRLQPASFLFFETGPSSGIPPLPRTLVEFVQVFENHLTQLLPVFR